MLALRYFPDQATASLDMDIDPRYFRSASAGYSYPPPETQPSVKPDSCGQSGPARAIAVGFPIGFRADARLKPLHGMVMQQAKGAFPSAEGSQSLKLPTNTRHQKA